MPAAVEAMATTPNSQSAMDASNADKKRNKLGYHRTSVACGQFTLNSNRCVRAFCVASLFWFRACRIMRICADVHVFPFVDPATVWRQCAINFGGSNEYLLLLVSSALPATEDSMFGSPGRFARTMRELYSIAEGMSIFPGRSTTAS